MQPPWVSASTKSPLLAVAARLVDCPVSGHDKPKVKITVIESPNVPNIGVGEATVTGMFRMLKQLKIDEAEFMLKSDATFKCAGRSENWSLDGKGQPKVFYNPFSNAGYVDGVETAYHYHRFGPRARSTRASSSPIMMPMMNCFAISAIFSRSMNRASSRCALAGCAGRG